MTGSTGTGGVATKPLRWYEQAWVACKSADPPWVVRGALYLLAFAATAFLCLIVSYLILQALLGDLFLGKAYSLIQFVDGMVDPEYRLNPEALENLGKPTVRLGVGALSIGILIAALDRLIGFPKGVRKYFAGGQPWGDRFDSLFENMGTIFIAVVTVLVGVYALLNDRTAADRPTAFTVPLIASSGMVGTGTSALRFHVLFGEWEDSLASDDGQQAFLRGLIETASACNREATRPVRMRVVGYASSSGSNQDNLQLANARASWLGRRLLQLSVPAEVGEDPRPVEVNVQRHTAYPAMATGMFPDSVAVGGNYSLPAGALNRRAEIQLLDMGICSAF